MANTKSLDLELSSSQYAYISDANQTGLDLNSDFTMEFWAKLESLSSGDHYVIMKYIASSKAYYAGFDSIGRMKLEFYNDAGVYTRLLSDNDITSIGNWKHYAITVDISVPSAVLYVDGVSVDITLDKTDATSIKNSSADFVIGAFKENSNSYVDGLIDEVRVWNDIRTATEISDNYQKELDGDESGLVGYWKFNDSALDETSNDNDLTLVNTPSYSSDVPSWATAYSLVCATGAFVLTGYPATFKRAYTLACAVGTFVLTGFDTAFNKGRTMVCETGAFILTGYDTIFKRTISLVCATGTFALTGFDATFQKAMKLVCSTGRFILTGYNVLFKSTGWNNDTKPTSSWTEDTKPTSSWTNEDK